ncbi:uncharacterized protein LOC113387934 [Ctenocephalides felis]|nr:uncharacterized protein LOC113387934 [Ctenocephalides felis]
MLKHYEQIKNNSILVLSSTYAIYKLRRMDPSIICILWLKSPALVTGFAASLYYSVVREFIVPLLGIPAVIVHKNLLSVNEVSRWQKIGVRAFGFPVNSPNTKRYYQLVLNTSYLTESIKTEPPIKVQKIAQ